MRCRLSPQAYGASMDSVNKRGETPLSSAFQKNEIMRLLLEFDTRRDPTLDLYCRDSIGPSPFRKLDGEISSFFEYAIDTAWAHIDKVICCTLISHGLVS